MTNIEEQNELLKTILLQGEKTRKDMRWLKIIGVIRITILVIPIIVAIIYLPPFIQKAIEQYTTIVPGIQDLLTK